MADILFITPNTEENIAQESVGTMLLATILRNMGLQVALLPFSHIGDPNDFHGFLSAATMLVQKEKPKIISFYTRCDNYHIMLKLAQQLKGCLDAYIVFGGPQADITAVATLQAIDYVDFICCGEGETTVYPFFSSLLHGHPDLTVPGLVYRRNGQVVQNPRPELIHDLDTLPDIDYSLVPYQPSGNSRDPFPVDVGRGCPFGCTYCSTKSFWGRKYRLKSPQRICSEIQQIHRLFGFSYFAFEHDMFTMNRKQVIETCRLLKALDFPVTWKCSARLDCLDRELIDFMAEAGLTGIFIGIETGSPRMQKLINKNLKLDGIMDLLSYIDSKGIKIITSFIYGLPEETEDDLSQTLALSAQILTLKNAQAHTHLCTFLPGTEMSRVYQPQLVPSANFSDITGATALEHCRELILHHPAIFPHFCEYPSQLRSSLAYLTEFVQAWTALQPVYQYFSEKYPQNRLFDMYRDFVNDNRQHLQDPALKSFSTRVASIIAHDQFAQRFREDPMWDIIRDYYRMKQLILSDDFRTKKLATAAFCFSPVSLSQEARLQDYARTLAIVVFRLDENGKLVMQIKTRH